MTHLEHLLYTANSKWPLFTEKRTEIILNLQKLQPIVSAEVDLPIAYAMTVWEDYRRDAIAAGCNWLSQVKSHGSSEL